MKTIQPELTRQIAGGAVFGPATINGHRSFITMLDDNKQFYYYHFDTQSGYVFKEDGSIFGHQGKVANNQYRTFINQNGYRCFFLNEDFFDNL